MEIFIEFLGFAGLICGMFRVIPQTIKTISSKDIKHLSYTFFLMHMLAGICGLIYESYQSAYSIPHLIFFIMVTITNAIQLLFMLRIRFKIN